MYIIVTMFKFKKQTWQRLKVASFAAIGGTMGIGLYQGLQLRENYVRSEKIQPPSGLVLNSAAILI